MLYDIWGDMEIKEWPGDTDSPVYPKIRLLWNESGVLTSIGVDVNPLQLAYYDFNSKKGIYEVNKRHNISDWDLSSLNLPKSIKIGEEVQGRHIFYTINFSRKMKKIINDSQLEELKKELEAEQ